MTDLLLEPPPTTPIVPVQPIHSLASVVGGLRALHRERTMLMGSRNMLALRLQALVAGTLPGEDASGKKRSKKELFMEAQGIIKATRKDGADHPAKWLVDVHDLAIGPLDGKKKAIEKRQSECAGQLPEHVLAWVDAPAQKGFGLPGLAMIVGEAGDLNAYANPAKLWRRMGCTPFSKGGLTRMGSTWRRGTEGKLTAEEWSAFGYSPRRRSLMHVIADSLMKGNTDAGPYKRRYCEAKEAAARNHPDWKPMRCHLHGLLLMGKLLLKNLWLTWTRTPDRPWAAAA